MLGQRSVERMQFDRKFGHFEHRSSKRRSVTTLPLPSVIGTSTRSGFPVPRNGTIVIESPLAAIPHCVLATASPRRASAFCGLARRADFVYVEARARARRAGYKSSPHWLARANCAESAAAASSASSNASCRSAGAVQALDLAREALRSYYPRFGFTKQMFGAPSRDARRLARNLLG